MSHPNLLLHCFFIGLLILFVSCNSDPEEPVAGQVEVSLQETMIINGGEGEDEPILASASYITTDPEGNIYIYDNDAYRILKYDREGRFLTVFGRKGGGPGEFETVTYLYADKNGRLIVTDSGNSRISVFDEEGDMILNQPQFKIRAVRHMSEMPDGRFLVSGWHPDRERMVHIINSDFSQIEASFVSLDEITEADDEQMLSAIRSMAGYAVVVEPGRIAFAPNYYTGRIYLYEVNEKDQWQLAGDTDGSIFEENPLEITSGGLGAMRDIPPSMIVSIIISNQSAQILYKVVDSHGLYPTAEGELVHFFSRYGEEDFNLIMEKFDIQSGDLQQYGILNYDSPEEIPNLRWMDPEGALYMSQGDTVRLSKMSVSGFLQD